MGCVDDVAGNIGQSLGTGHPTIAEGKVMVSALLNLSIIGGVVSIETVMKSAWFHRMKLE